MRSKSPSKVCSGSTHNPRRDSYHESFTVEEIEAQNMAENMLNMTALKASPIPHWVFPTTNGHASEV